MTTREATTEEDDGVNRESKITVRYINFAGILDSKTNLQYQLEDVTNDEELQKKLNEHEAYLFPLKYKP